MLQAKGGIGTACHAAWPCSRNRPPTVDRNRVLSRLGASFLFRRKGPPPPLGMHACEVFTMGVCWFVRKQAHAKGEASSHECPGQQLRAGGRGRSCSLAASKGRGGQARPPPPPKRPSIVDPCLVSVTRCSPARGCPQTPGFALGSAGAGVAAAAALVTASTPHLGSTLSRDGSQVQVARTQPSGQYHGCPGVCRACHEATCECCTCRWCRRCCCHRPAAPGHRRSPRCQHPATHSQRSIHPPAVVATQHNRPYPLCNSTCCLRCQAATRKLLGHVGDCCC